MKKKMAVCVMAAAMAAAVLTGCGGDAEPADSGSAVAESADAGETAEPEAVCEHDWAEADCTTPKTCTLCGETEGQALGHEWIDATFAEPKTCSVCGETEGDVKQSYFEENGLTVADAPVSGTTDVLLYNKDIAETRQNAVHCVWEQLDCYSEPAEEDGYQLVYLELSVSGPMGYYDAIRDVVYSGGPSNWIYDWYSGKRFIELMVSEEANGSSASESYEGDATLEVDGVSYDVSYSLDDAGDGEVSDVDEIGNLTVAMTLHSTYCFKVPDGYDGLVLGLVPGTGYHEEDTESLGEKEGYAADEDYVDGTKFFRINKEGMVPERAE